MSAIEARFFFFCSLVNEGDAGPDVVGELFGEVKLNDV